MTPGARVQAAIEVLDAIAAGGVGRGRSPADAVLNGYVRARRYIGSKDRAAIASLVYSVLRHRAQLDWWLAFARSGASRGRFAIDSRRRVIAALAIVEGWPAPEFEESFDGSKFRPAMLEEGERHLAGALTGRSLEHPEQPDSVRFNTPDWLLPSLRARFGEDFAREMEVLSQPASVDLRINALKTDRNAARKLLAAAGVTTTPTPLSPVGLRVEGRPNLPALAVFKDG